MMHISTALARSSVTYTLSAIATAAPRLEGWNYNLFAMVHGMNAEQIEYERNLIRDQLGDACRADTMLISSRILKKTGLRLAAQRQEK